MRILALVTDAFGGSGGIAQYNRDLMTALSSAGEVESIHILPRLAPGPLVDLPKKAWQAKPTFGRMLYALKAFGEAVRTKPDLLICGHLFMAPLAQKIGQMIGAPVAIQLHGVEVFHSPTRAQWQALEKAALVLCVSRHTRAQVLKFTRVDPHRAVVVPNTFGEDYRPGEREKMRSALRLADEFAVLTVGRLDKGEGYKGHDRIIRALPNLPNGLRRVIYLISGDGDDRARLEALAASLGVGDRVRFLGFTPREALPELYRAADLFAMPSTDEGFGIVFLEAMASGTPALGLAAGGAADPLDFEEWGKAVSEADLEGALLQAIASPRPEPGMMREAVAKRFGFDVFARQAIGQIVDRFSERPASI